MLPFCFVIIFIMFPLKDKIQLPGFAVITAILVFINAYVFYLEISAVDLTKFIEAYALIPSALGFSNPLPLITYQFLHGGWVHLLTNMWFLVIFGPNLERVWGHAKFLLFYLAAGAAAAFAQIFFTSFSDIPMLGASGAVAGVLGAYFVYFPSHRINTLVPLGFIPLFLAIPAGIVLLYWFGLQVVAGAYTDNLINGGVAFFAHIGGFLTGVILASATRIKVKYPENFD